jgi:hypothetical protein
MKQLLIKCEECNKEFFRDLKEINRSKKIGRRFFCSLKCSCTFIDRERIKKGEKFSFPKEYFGNKGKEKNIDEFTPYRPIFKYIKNRKRIIHVSLTLQDIKDMWTQQNGLCAYTKIKLELPKWNNIKKINTASIDRIDSSKGYTKDNCQIISVMANFAKNDFSDNDMKEFCKQIYENYNRTS